MPWATPSSADFVPYPGKVTIGDLTAWWIDEKDSRVPVFTGSVNLRNTDSMYDFWQKAEAALNPVEVEHPELDILASLTPDQVAAQFKAEAPIRAARALAEARALREASDAAIAAASGELPKDKAAALVHEAEWSKVRAIEAEARAERLALEARQ